MFTTFRTDVLFQKHISMFTLVFCRPNTNEVRCITPLVRLYSQNRYPVSYKIAYNLNIL